MKRLRLALLAVSAVSATTWAAVTYAGRSDKPGYCLATEVMVERFTTTRDGERLGISYAESRRLGICVFAGLFDDPEFQVDGILFDDCVVWWADGEESTAEREGLLCDPPLDTMLG
jgi:hypothetical protein